MIAPSDYAKYTVWKTEETEDWKEGLVKPYQKKKKCTKEQVHLERQYSQDQVDFDLLAVWLLLRNLKILHFNYFN